MILAIPTTISLRLSAHPYENPKMCYYVCMGHHQARVREIRTGASGHTEASLTCPAGSIPPCGQYLLAVDLDDRSALLATPLFAVEKTNQGFWSTPLSEVSWSPGTILDLAGPLGHGFDLPENMQRLGLVALGETVSRLVPLVHQITLTHTGITLFTDLRLPPLPAALEVYPLASLHEMLDWPDFLALDVPVNRLADLRQVLGLSSGERLACPAQALIVTSIPCGGLGMCGVCAVAGRKGWKLVCEDGPVFDLNSLKW